MGWWNCTERTSLRPTRSPLLGTVIAYSQFAASCVFITSKSFITSASSPHASTHSWQPVQSRGDTWMRKRMLFSAPPPVALSVLKPSGAFAASSSVSSTGRMQACGHTVAHWLHWMHLSICHSGFMMAMPRFSYCVVPEGITPPGRNADTGRLSPSYRTIGSITLFTNSGAPSISCGFSTSAFIHASRGYSIWCTASSELSMQSQLFRTMCSPFLMYVFSTIFFMIGTTSSTSMQPVSLKYTIPIVVFTYLPRWYLPASAVASTTKSRAFFRARMRFALPGSSASISSSVVAFVFSRKIPFSFSAENISNLYR